MSASSAGPCAAPPSVAEALSQAQAGGLDRLDAQWLLGHVLQRPRSWLMAHDTDLILPGQAHQFARLCEQRADGMPVAYLLGERGFHGLMLAVSPAVLVPRPDTETLVDWALERLNADTAGAPRVLDLGTGSGAVALAVRHCHPSAQVTATDLSGDALAVAAANAHRLALPIRLLAGPWWQALPADEAPFDLVLSNPPYIAGDDPHLPALRHEPRLALTPEGDGLAALRDIVAGAPAHLKAGAWLLLEHGWDQAEAVSTLLRRAGFSDIETRRDLGGQARCTGGRLSPKTPARSVK